VKGALPLRAVTLYRLRFGEDGRPSVEAAVHFPSRISSVITAAQFFSLPSTTKGGAPSGCTEIITPELHSAIFGAARTLARHRPVLLGTVDGRVFFLDPDTASAEALVHTEDLNIIANLNVSTAFSHCEKSWGGDLII